MLKFLSARSRRKRLNTGSIARAHSGETTQPFVTRILRFVVLSIFGIGSIVLVLFFLYRTILSSALQLPEPKLLLLVPKSVEAEDKRMYLVQLAPEFKDSYILSLKPDQEVQLPAGYGKYRLSAIYPLLKIDKRDDQFITASFSRGLGRVIDQTYGLESLAFNEMTFSRTIFNIVTSQLLSTQTVHLEAVKLWYFARQGMPVSEVGTVADVHATLAQKNTEDRNLNECQLGILNASGQDGAATALSNLFENSGLITIRTSSYPQEEPTTTVFHSGKEECARVVAMVSKAFVKKPVITVDEKITTQYRAPIVIILGKDFE
jgi:hypothetical protein